MTILNVYINGTDESNSLEGQYTSLANVLHAITVQDENQSSICLEGCGVNNPNPFDLGGLFTFYLGTQINKVIKTVKSKLKDGEKLTLNLYGFSRGGAAVFWICKKLAHISPDLLEINVVSIEPVAGNFKWASKLGKRLGINLTLSNIIADLSKAENIKNCLVLLTNKHMADIMGHAPVLPILPGNANTRVDVIPGCHKNAEIYKVSQNKYLSDLYNSGVTFRYVVDFLSKCGVQFDHNRFEPQSSILQITNLDSLKSILGHNINQDHRSMHYDNAIISDNSKPYLNLWHQELSTGVAPTDNSQCKLSVKNPAPQSNTFADLKITTLEEQAKKSELQKALVQYSKKSLFTPLSSLGRDKRKLALQCATSEESFANIQSTLLAGHDKLAQKANKTWIMSNRWKARGSEWKEEQNSEMGRIIKHFKPK